MKNAVPLFLVFVTGCLTFDLSLAAPSVSGQQIASPYTGQPYGVPPVELPLTRLQISTIESQVSLIDAIEIALNETGKGSIAVDAGLLPEPYGYRAGKYVIQVIDNNSSQQQITLDATTGEVLQSYPVAVLADYSSVPFRPDYSNVMP